MGLLPGVRFSERVAAAETVVNTPGRE